MKIFTVIFLLCNTSMLTTQDEVLSPDKARLYISKEEGLMPSDDYIFIAPSLGIELGYRFR